MEIFCIDYDELLIELEMSTNESYGLIENIRLGIALGIRRVDDLVLVTKEKKDWLAINHNISMLKVTL